jgi:ferritin-like metal-binding protein YciE
MKTLEDLFLDSLADIYYAENQLTKALPKMAKAARRAVPEMFNACHQAKGTVETKPRLLLRVSLVLSQMRDCLPC